MAIKIILKRGKAKPFYFRHPWVFSGAVESVKGEPADGDVVDVLDHDRKFIGRGFFNSKSRIQVRFCLFDESGRIDRDLFAQRIRCAVRFRTDTLCLPETTTAWRVVHSEGDGLGGLVVDRYNDFLVVQFHARGLESRREMILDALEAELSPAGIIDRSIDAQRAGEGLEPSSGVLRGSVPEETTVTELGISHIVNLHDGQKTGFYLDQRVNRARLRKFAKGRRVLDLFTYTGATAVNAAAGGASGVIAVDSSERWLEFGRKSAEAAGFPSIDFRRAKVADALRDFSEAGEKFGVIFMDPPPFAPSSRDVASAVRTYKFLCSRALKLLEPGGVLACSSCSAKVGPGELAGALKEATKESGGHVRIFDVTGQAEDHPVSVYCPEGAYLTTVWAGA